MIKAIYRLREDGDYDFVAAFATDEMPDDWPGQIREYLENEGESVRTVSLGSVSELPDVLTP